MAKSYYNWYDSNEFTFRSVTFYVNLFYLKSLFLHFSHFISQQKNTNTNADVGLHNFPSTYKKWTLSPCSLRTSMITSLLLPFSCIPFVRHHHLFAHELSEPHDDITYIQPLQIINITTLALLVSKYVEDNHISKLWYWMAMYIQPCSFICRPCL